MLWSIIDSPIHSKERCTVQDDRWAFTYVASSYADPLEGKKVFTRFSKGSRFNSHRIGLGIPKRAPFCLGTPKHDGRDVMWKNTIYIIEKVAKDLLTQHFTVSYMIFLLFLSDFNIIHNAPWTQTYLLLSGWSYSYLCFSSSILYNQNRGNCNVKNKTHDHFRKHSS